MEIMAEVGNFAERKYQLAAQKRSEAAIKFDNYNQTAKYFERECGKAKQFNNWKIDNLKSSYQDNIRKAQELESRQNRLKELIKAEEEEYNRQSNQLILKNKLPREQITLETLKNQLKEKRSERSLYTPIINRRIQSYFSNPIVHHTSRSPLIELNNSRVIKSPKMSLENTNLRDNFNSGDDATKDSKESMVDYSHVREDFDERALAAKENRSNSLMSNFGNDYNPKDIHYSSVSSRPLSKTHHSNVLYGNQTMLRENDEFDNANVKFAKRYEHGSLENTNLSDYSPNKINQSDNIHSEVINNDEIDDNEILNASGDDKNDSGSGPNLSERFYHDKSNDLITKVNDINLHYDEDGNNDKAVDDIIDYNFPAGRLSCNDKSRSELIYLYLTHNDLKRKISELEVREHRATIKGLWEDALRLRDMKNRLELMREREIYQREDLQIDPETRQFVVDNIDQRKRVLEDREKSCSDSNMYSEDAKLLWNKWVKEDEKPFIIHGINQRELLLQQLETEWRKLAEDDKQRLTYTYNNIMMGSSLQNELKLITSRIPI